MHRLLGTRSLATRILSPVLHLSPRRTLKLPRVLQVIPDAVNRANAIDRQYKQSGSHPTEVKVEEIIRQVQNEPDLLYQLAFFFQKCKRLGITQDNVESRRRLWGYWMVFLNNLMPLNGAFWDTMQLMGKSQHTHRLNPFSIGDIGLLDPKNFPRDFYKEVMTGRYKGLDYRDRVIFSWSKPKWEDPEDK
ncbi:hypothetical protein Cantr_10335 [Candida viswanathii]|uniref:Uncharacterized protein n=1 Tax=Candida viswanathii TaxID=5486 RepID=A0A367YD15_9ASCO|nr:hypothetical protein Cantr_10335 [Candida viswanathii]